MNKIGYGFISVYVNDNFKYRKIDKILFENGKIDINKLFK